MSYDNKDKNYLIKDKQTRLDIIPAQFDNIGPLVTSLHTIFLAVAFLLKNNGAKYDINDTKICDAFAKRVDYSAIMDPVKEVLGNDSFISLEEVLLILSFILNHTFPSLHSTKRELIIKAVKDKYHPYNVSEHELEELVEFFIDQLLLIKKEDFDFSSELLEVELAFIKAIDFGNKSVEFTFPLIKFCFKEHVFNFFIFVKKEI